MDKFLRGEENTWKQHPNYINYNYQYLDKSFPTAEQAHDLISKPSKILPKKFWADI